MYEKQYAWVRWRNAKSEMFLIVNGTRQGIVLSPALFRIYMDDILANLRTLGVGCYVWGVFMGSMGYADDLVLLILSRTAMQMMLQACEEFGTRNNLQMFIIILEKGNVEMKDMANIANLENIKDIEDIVKI